MIHFFLRNWSCKLFVVRPTQFFRRKILEKGFFELKKGNTPGGCVPIALAVSNYKSCVDCEEIFKCTSFWLSSPRLDFSMDFWWPSEKFCGHYWRIPVLESAKNRAIMGQLNMFSKLISGTF